MIPSHASTKVWPVVPDWTNGVSETLTWSTEVLWASGTGVSQHRGLRIAPSRSLAIEALGYGSSRRLAESLLAGWSGDWWLPIWPDVQWLSGALPAGSAGIECDTKGLDFVDGGHALLYEDAGSWELLAIERVNSDGLVFGSNTSNAHGVGCRLYPLRRARARDGAQEELSTDELSMRSITFDISEACDFPELDSPTLYLGHPVLDVRPDEGEQSTASFSRMSQTVDYGTSLPVVYDLPGIAFRAQQSHWLLQGRDQHTWFRSLAYTLQGQRVPIWVPSFAADLMVVAAIVGTTLKVEWTGYTQFGFGCANRRDIRIELYDGRIFYRRITRAVEAPQTEILTLDRVLDSVSIDTSAIRQISFLMLATLATDQIEIDHLTDASGAAKATTGWKGVVPDV